MLASGGYWVCRHLVEIEIGTLHIDRGFIASLKHHIFSWGSEMNAVDRMSQYFDLPPEPSASSTSVTPPAAWPSSSTTPLAIVEGLTVKANAEQDLADGLSLSFDSGERVALVGRFGSGKSALAMSFLRFAEPLSGRILVDGISIANIDLQILRSRIVGSTIQLPVLTDTHQSFIVTHISGCRESAINSNSENTNFGVADVFRDFAPKS